MVLNSHSSCMHRITINAPSASYEVTVGGTLAEVEQLIDARNTFVLTDSTVHHLHGASFPHCPVFVLSHGEAAKSLSALPDIYSWLLAQGANRQSTLIGIGGGSVCDVAGFVASTFMRGIGLGLVPTTLLAQIDAAIGGKNGLNFDSSKNIVGTFYQPRFVHCVPELLSTLPLIEIQSALGEMVKYAIIDSPRLFAKLEQQANLLRNGNIAALVPQIVEAVQIKARVVCADEREGGLRRILNLGHTWGHAVEAITHKPHGLCVSEGIAFAARLSVERGLLSNVVYERICGLFRALELPINIQVDKKAAIEAMRSDKKRHGSSVAFVLIRNIGDVVVENVDFAELEHFCDDMP